MSNNNTHKSLGPVTTTRSCSVGGNARYDMTGTRIDFVYNATANSYAPSGAIRFTAAHNGGSLFGAAISNGYALAHGGPPRSRRKYPKPNSSVGVFFTNDTVSNFLIDGCRFHRCWDAIRFGQDSTVSNVTIRQCWFSDTYDDMIENDNHRDGVLIEDCLSDRTFVAVSDRNKGTENHGDKILTMRNCLMQIGSMYVLTYTNPQFQFFKLNALSISFDLFDNIFHVPSVVDATNRKTEGDPFFDLKDRNKIRTSSGNQIVWGGGGAYPYSLPTGFTVTSTASVWTNARNAWLTNHSDVPRIPGVDT